MKRGAPGERLTRAALHRLRHPELRREAEAALARAEDVRLLEGASEGQPVQTVVIGEHGRAGQSLGATVLWGEWLDGRLHAAGGAHLLDADGRCTCQACDLAAGYFGDDAE